jgi:UDP:flavonoid glycosyltransferase YjiC (YdhE family)
MNTALESLSHGVPMLAIPVTNDQPGVAARIHWLQVGRRLLLNRLNVPAARAAIREVLEEERYAVNARVLQREIQSLDGPGRAAEIVETAIATRQPVLREPTETAPRFAPRLASGALQIPAKQDRKKRWCFA